MSVKMQNLGPLMVETTRIWRTRLDQRLRRLGLSQAKWMALVRIGREGSLTQKALADKLGIEGASLVSLLDRLESDGWIERRQAERDRRAKVVMLTEKALPVMQEIEKVAATLRADLIKDIPEEDLETTMRVLELIKTRAERA